MRETAKVQQIRVMPGLNVIKIGGHGVIDYGKKVIYPLVEEIGELSLNHEVLVATGGGARTRHILDVAGSTSACRRGCSRNWQARSANRTRS